VAKADFLKWKPRKRFDRVVMNPPFSEARWPAHLEHAASLVAPGGRLVAVLPKGARNRKGLLAGWSKRWSEDIEGEFAGTSAVVVILTAEREQEV
jgi:tRNA1(Val) A37 N6-methylase TrmN6